MNANNSWPPDPRASSLQPPMHRDTVLMAQVTLSFYREHAYKLCFTELFLNTMSLEYTMRRESGVVRSVRLGNRVVRLGFRSPLAKAKVPRASRVIRSSPMSYVSLPSSSYLHDNQYLQKSR